MAEPSRSRSKVRKVSISVARYLVMLPANVPVSIADAARLAGRARAVGLRHLLAAGTDGGYLELRGDTVIRRIGVYHPTMLEVPHKGFFADGPRKLTAKQYALLSTLKVDSMVVFGHAFAGAFVVECADGATLRPGHQPAHLVAGLVRAGALKKLCSDDLADYLVLAVENGSSTNWDDDIDIR